MPHFRQLRATLKTQNMCKQIDRQKVLSFVFDIKTRRRRRGDDIFTGYLCYALV